MLDCGTAVDAVVVAGERFRPLPGAGFPVPGGGLAEIPLLNAGTGADWWDGGHGGAGVVGGEAVRAKRGLGGAQPSLAQQAREAGVPAFECSDLGEERAVGWLKADPPDVVCVACWPRRIPPRALAAARHGFLNVHPSLLPAYRGPHPLFWQFQAGETETGVTVHWMDAGLDTGSVAAQASVRYGDGIRGAQAELLAAEAGSALLVAALREVGRGRAVRRPQRGEGSYFAAPSADSFALDPGWTARRAFNFMRATAEWKMPFRYGDGGTVLWLKDALGWTGGRAPDGLPASAVRLRFRDGALWALERARRPD